MRLCCETLTDATYSGELRRNAQLDDGPIAIGRPAAEIGGVNA
jgi:hypothetical protein